MQISERGKGVEQARSLWKSVVSRPLRRTGMQSQFNITIFPPNLLAYNYNIIYIRNIILLINNNENAEFGYRAIWFQNTKSLVVQ